MAPRTKMTPDQVEAQIRDEKIEIRSPIKQEKHKGINKNIELVTPDPTFEQIWEQEEK